MGLCERDFAQAFTPAKSPRLWVRDRAMGTSRCPVLQRSWNVNSKSSSHPAIHRCLPRPPHRWVSSACYVPPIPPVTPALSSPACSVPLLLPCLSVLMFFLEIARSSCVGSHNQCTCCVCFVTSQSKRGARKIACESMRVPAKKLTRRSYWRDLWLRCLDRPRGTRVADPNSKPEVGIPLSE